MKLKHKKVVGFAKADPTTLSSRYEKMDDTFCPAAEYHLLRDFLRLSSAFCVLPISLSNNLQSYKVRLKTPVKHVKNIAALHFLKRTEKKGNPLKR